MDEPKNSRRTRPTSHTLTGTDPLSTILLVAYIVMRLGVIVLGSGGVVALACLLISMIRNVAFDVIWSPSGIIVSICLAVVAGGVYVCRLLGKGMASLVG